MERPLYAAVVLLALALATPTLAADIEARLVIDQVTVYPQTANITRSGRVTVPVGSHRLIVRGLPDPIDTSNLRIYATSNAVRLGGVEVQKIVDKDYVSDAERALRKRLVTLQDQRIALQDEIHTAEAQLKLIDSLATLPTDRNGKSIVESVSIQGTLATIGTGSEAARAKIRAANIAIRELDDEVTQVKGELAKIATARKTSTEVRATIEASAEATIPISLEYRVADAAWDWLYEARLDTQTKRMSMFRQASIRQGSGEDWTNAEVSVTTAKPRQNAGTPPVRSVFVSLEDYVVPRATSEDLAEITVTGSRRVGGRRSRESSREDVQEAPVITTDEFATEFVQDFRIPSRVSINSDRQVRVYPVSEELYDTDLVARAVMAVDPTARIEAAFHYAQETPIEAGRLQLYRDGAYVGTASLPLLLPGSDVRIPFGVDERIRIVVRDEKAESGRRGVLGRQVLSEHRRRYEITSYHAAALPIEVIDRIPVTKDSGIKVEVLDGATPPTTKDFDGKAGVFLWRLPGTPKKTETIRHLYSVRYPGDKVLSLSDSGED